MFLCTSKCGSFYSGCFTSHGPCEECGKVADCWDVPVLAWQAESKRREEARQANILALSTYPCPKCGETDLAVQCTCGTMKKLLAMVRHDTDIRELLRVGL